MEPCRGFERGTVARESKRSLALPLFLVPPNKAQPPPSHGPSLPEYALHSTYLLKESTLVSRHVCFEWSLLLMFYVEAVSLRTVY